MVNMNQNTKFSLACTRNTVRIVLQFLCLSRTIAIGIPLCIIKPELMSIWYWGGVAVLVSAVVHIYSSTKTKKNCKTLNCKTICTTVLERLKMTHKS